MLAFCSYKIWRDCQDGQSGITLRNWVWASTATYFANGLLGASYVISWDSGSFSEYLSLAHLMVATVSFTVLATAWLRLQLCPLPEERVLLLKISGWMSGKIGSYLTLTKPKVVILLQITGILAVISHDLLEGGGLTKDTAGTIIVVLIGVF